MTDPAPHHTAACTKCDGPVDAANPNKKPKATGAKADIEFLERRLAGEKKKNAVLRETYGETRARTSVVQNRQATARRKLAQLQELLAVFASRKPAERAKQLPPESKLRSLAKALKYKCFYTAQLKRGRSKTKRAVLFSEDSLDVARERIQSLLVRRV